MKNKKLKSTSYALAIIIGFTAATIAAPPPCVAPCGPPGWTFGGANCGPAGGGANAADCDACCRNAALTGAILASEVGNCISFCGQAVFNGPTLLDKVFVWIFG